MSLLHIQTAPAAETAVIHLHPSDNVAIARVTLSSGQSIRVANREIRAAASIPAGHKIALRDIAPGEAVIRYGSFIGRASAPIHAGDPIHTHNLAFEETVIGDDLLNANTPPFPLSDD